MQGTKGIFQQMQDLKVHKYESLTKKEIIDFFEKNEKEAKKQLIKREKEVKENLKHLKKKSKEFNEEIPLYLLLVATSIPMMHVGSNFIKTYKKWLND